MGTIAQLFESGGQSADKGHFNNLVMLARVDGNIEEAEIKLLTRIAQRLSLTSEQVKEIIEHSDQYPMVPPVSREERYERFISFVQMMLVDDEIDASEKRLIDKYGIALGFKTEGLNEKFKSIVDHLRSGKSNDEVLAAIM